MNNAKLPDGIHLDADGNYRNQIGRVVVSNQARSAQALRIIADNIAQAYGDDAKIENEPKVVYPAMYGKPRLTWAR